MSDTAATSAATADAGQATDATNGEQQQAQTGEQQQGVNPNAPDMTGWPQAAIDAWNTSDAARHRLQQEAGNARTQAKDAARAEGIEAGKSDALAELAKVLGPALGLTTGEQAPTVESLTATVTERTGELEAARTDLTNARREAALVRAAWDAGIDPTRMGYLEYLVSKDATLAAADPTADTFGATLKASIDGLVAQDATLKRAGSVQASGVETHGGAVTGDMTPEAWQQLSTGEKQHIFLTNKPLYDRMNGRGN